MPSIKVKDISGKEVGSLDLNEKVWGQEVNQHLLWEAVKWQTAKRRSGNHSSKTVAEVSGTGKKPFKQKGTGRARAGNMKAQHHVGGGRIFAPKPRDYEYRFPKSARKSALRSALSLRMSEENLVVVDNLQIGEAKTKRVAAALEALGGKKALVVDVKENGDLVKGTRNLQAAKWLAPEGLNVYDILNHEMLVITADCAKRVEEALMPGKKSA